MILYGSETWTEPEKQSKLIEPIQNKCIRTLLKLPNSTPIPAITGETGLLPLKYIIQQKQLNFLYRLKSLPDTRLVKQMFITQNQYYAYNHNNWTNHMNTLSLELI